MRKYQIIIGNKELVLDYSSDNPSGPQIQFNIQQFSVSQTVNAEITLYNIAPYYFSMNQYLIGKQIQLFAGVEDTPITRMVGYSGQYGLIAAGFISAVIPEWNGNDTSLSIIFMPQPVIASAVPYLLKVNKGQDIRSLFIDAYKAITGNAENIDLGTTPILSTTSYQQKIDNVSDIALTLQQQHGITLNQTKAGFQVNTVVGKNINLVPGDFVTQPSALNISQVALTLQLRADVQIGDYVKLPSNVYVGITVLDSIRVQSQLNAFQNKNVFLLFSGLYLISKIWQLGDSHNPNPEAWATILHGVRA